MKENAKKALACAAKVQRAYLNAAPALGISIMIAMQNIAFAANTTADLQKLVRLIIQGVAMLLTVFGIIRLVTAIAEYAQAGADDGPAKAKAKNDLAMAAMIFAIGVILNLSASVISGLINVAGLTG